MATKKARATAKVTLDAATAQKLASSLRDGLAGSTAYFVYEAQQGKPRGAAAKAVELDPGKVAAFVRHLHEGLGAAGAITPGEVKRMAPSKAGARQTAAGGGARQGAKAGAKAGAKKSRG